MVWAYDEDTGTSDWKKVVQVFRNETLEWCHVSIDGMDEAIVSTPGHKYYLPENEDCREVGEKHEHTGYESLSVKWVSACNLKKGDNVLLSNGKYGIVKSVKIEHLSEPETTYNFEVEDYHTYYVGESGVCVHNTCKEVKRVFDEFAVESFDDLAAKYTSDEVIAKLDQMGYSKYISMQNPNSPATEMLSSSGKLKFRIQAVNPQHGTAYFRVFNAGGGALNTSGIFPSWAGKVEMRKLTHFYFKGD